MSQTKRKLYGKSKAQINNNKRRRSSLQVNLSYVMDLSDSENNDSSQEKQHNSSNVNFQKSMNNDISYVLENINEEDEALNQTCSRLREQIVDKTREIFDKQHDFYEQTRKVMTGEVEVNSTVKSKTQITSPILRGNNCNIIKSTLRETRASAAAALDKYLTSSQMTNDFQDESLVMGAPVTSSTLTNHQCTIHETCNTPITSNITKRTCKTRIPVVEKSTIIMKTPVSTKEKPTIKRIEQCHISLNKIDGLSITKNTTIHEVNPMELTEMQGNCILNETTCNPDNDKTKPKNSESINHLSDVIENVSSAESKKRKNPSMYVNTSLGCESMKSKRKSTESPEEMPGQHVEHAEIHNDGGGSSIIDEITDSDGAEENLSLIERLRNISQEKSKRTSNVPSKRTSINSTVEGTPRSITRSMLRNTQIRQNLTLQHAKTQLVKRIQLKRKRLSNKDQLKLENTIVLDSSPIGNPGCHIIEDSSDDECRQIKANVNETNRKVMKKKLFTQQNSPGRVISFSPMPSDIMSPQVATSKQIKRRRLRRNVAGRIIQSQYERQKTQLTLTQRAQKTQIPSSSSSGSSQDIVQRRRLEKSPKKKRLVKSKKIVVKKTVNSKVLSLKKKRDKSLDNRDLQTSRRSSVFMNSKRLSTKNNKSNQNIVIVATGLSNSNKDTVKEAVKRLGLATMESTVSRKTTHVVTTGVRTINLLRGIIRGCWLVKIDWIIKSIEAGRWLSAESYEIDHFSTAVKENRRDREILGSAYVPELFTTCGSIFIERDTIPAKNVLRDLIKTAGGIIADEAKEARIIIGPGGIKENWIFDSISTGKVQPTEQYKNE